MQSLWSRESVGHLYFVRKTPFILLQKQCKKRNWEHNHFYVRLCWAVLWDSTQNFEPEKTFWVINQYLVVGNINNSPKSDFWYKFGNIKPIKFWRTDSDSPQNSAPVNIFLAVSQYLVVIFINFGSCVFFSSALAILLCFFCFSYGVCYFSQKDKFGLSKTGTFQKNTNLA